MAKQETNNRTMGVLYGRALVQPTTIDQEAREGDVVCATEKMVTRFSRSNGPRKSGASAFGLS